MCGFPEFRSLAASNYGSCYGNSSCDQWVSANDVVFDTGTPADWLGQSQ
jgi:hypothetical protein